MKFLKTAIISGCCIFCFTAMGMLCHEAVMVLLFILFIPGPLFGLLIALFKPAPLSRRIAFVLATCGIYAIALYLSDIVNIDSNLSAIRILLSGTIGSVLLQLCFDIVFRFRVDLKNTFIIPATRGLAASLLAGGSAMIFKTVPVTSWMNTFLWLGLLSIFPIWYYLFGKHLVKSGKIPG